jgi:hypothetical protein
VAPHAAHAQETRWGRCVVGISYGAPLKLAVSTAYGRVVEGAGDGHDLCHYASARLGIGGARATVGTMRTVSRWGGALGVSAGVLRTFGSPLHAQRWRNYAGASVQLLPAIALGGELGYYVRLGGDVSGAPARRMVTWSVGFGF